MDFYPEHFAEISRVADNGLEDTALDSGYFWVDTDTLQAL
jgi:hypothetical protein